LLELVGRKMDVGGGQVAFELIGSLGSDDDAGDYGLG